MNDLFRQIRELNDDLFKSFLEWNVPTIGENWLTHTTPTHNKLTHNTDDAKSDTVSKDRDHRNNRNDLVEGNNTNTTGHALQERLGGMLNMPIQVLEEKPDLVKIGIKLPEGLDKGDVNINVRDNMISIQGGSKCEKNDEKSGTRSYSSRNFHIMRSLPQHTRVEEITSCMKDGQLCISLPRDVVKEKESNERRIEIQ